jgi:hypothetical protein
MSERYSNGKGSRAYIPENFHIALGEWLKQNNTGVSSLAFRMPSDKNGNPPSFYMLENIRNGRVRKTDKRLLAALSDLIGFNDPKQNKLTPEIKLTPTARQPQPIQPQETKNLNDYQADAFDILLSLNLKQAKAALAHLEIIASAKMYCK